MMLMRHFRQRASAMPLMMMRAMLPRAPHVDFAMRAAAYAAAAAAP